MRQAWFGTLFGACLLLAAGVSPARAQFGPAGPPAVGVVTVQPRPVTESSEFIGRIEATDRVAVVARVTAFLQERLFIEGAEVQKGDLLYKLERGPFEADLAAKQAAVAQSEALLRNASITLGRAQALVRTAAGTASAVDDAVAQQASLTAQLQANQAQLRASQINLDYTEIRSPIAGKIGRSAVTVGNVVGPSSGTLTTIVSQDPMYVTFAVAVKASLELRAKYADKGGFAGVAIRVRLADGRLYPIAGRLDYIDPSVAANTDTLVLRARIGNPVRADARPGDPGNRELLDGEFVTVLVEGVQPVMALAIPRAAVLSDQQGSYVYVVDADKKVAQRRITLGQSTPLVAVVTAGLTAGETVVADGIQRVRPGIVVNPAPIAAAPPGGAANTPAGTAPPAAPAPSAPAPSAPAPAAPAPAPAKTP